MRVLFYPAADRRQDEIWDYTFRQWDADQADAYIIGLHDALHDVAAEKILWRTLSHPQLTGIYYFRYEHHFIFFRVLSSNAIGVISILHETMDLPLRLFEDSRDLLIK
jgi:plasmid stabilization system protein ParE